LQHIQTTLEIEACQGFTQPLGIEQVGSVVVGILPAARPVADDGATVCRWNVRIGKPCISMPVDEV